MTVEAEDALIWAVTEALRGALMNDDLTQAELAKRLGKSRALVSQILCGERNMTLRTAASLASALDREFVFELRQR